MAFRKKEDQTQITIVKPKKVFVEVTITGLEELVVHQFSDKSARTIAKKQSEGDEKKATKREKRDPNQELQDTYYKLSPGKDGEPRYGFPARGIKEAITTAASRYHNMEKPWLNGLLWIHGEPSVPHGMFSSRSCVEIISPQTIGRTDMVRLKGINRPTDIRYRGSFPEWKMKFVFELEPDFVSVETLANLLESAGSRVGIGEDRPEKGGDWGRFTVCGMKPIERK